MNLNYKFPSIYWATACLSINAGGADDENGTTANYGKIASAIGRIQNQGIKVKLPSINKAKFGFTPDVDTNSILYGLKGISGVSDDLSLKIIENRPFSSFDNFLNKINPSRSECLSLIKAGSFDELESSISRKELMYNYLHVLNPPKTRITLQNMSNILSHNLLPNNKAKFGKLYNFNKYIKFFAKDDKYIIDDRAYKFLSENFDVDNLEQNGKETFMYKTVWDKLYKVSMEPLKDYLSNNQEKYITKLQNAEINDMWESSCRGSDSSWEMETLGFYYHQHELKGINHPEFNFVDYEDLPEIPKPEKYNEFNGRKIPVYKISSICGTVLDKVSYRHTITLLTPSGVITVKCVSEQFSEYDKQISKTNEQENKKEIVERSWFKRGNKLIVNGWRSGDMFMARGRKSEDKYPFYLINGIDDLGRIDITRFRAGED